MPSSRSVEFSREAEVDLREIHDTWGEAQQVRYAAALDDAFSQLANYPELGSALPALFPGCRIRRVQQHLIYYRIRGDTVLVIRVLHSRADTATHFAGAAEQPEP